MSDLGIGLSGLKAAQSAIDIIGNNIANAATEGYHKQVIQLSPSYTSQTGGVLVGGGVSVDGAVRMIDTMLEREILKQNSLQSSLNRELTTLRTVENMLGEFQSQGTLSVAIDNFFNSLEDLSLSPADSIWQNQLLGAAQSLVDQFNFVGDYLYDLQSQMQQQAEIAVEEINQLTALIAEMNDQIAQVEMTGGDVSSLKDQRDKYLTDLSELVGVDVTNKANGVIDLIISNVPVVSGSTLVTFVIGHTDEGELGLVIEGGTACRTNVTGGTLGGLLSLSNNLIEEIQEQLDTLAVSFIDRVNEIHTQSVGASGAFTSLTGVTPISGMLSENDAISDGTFYIRVTNTTTGQTTRQAVDVLTTDTLADIATKISAIGGLTGSVENSKLSINADVDYEFDFTPALLPEPSASDLSIDVAVSGIYSGASNKVYTCTVVGDGDISNLDDLSLEISVDGQLIKTVNIGTGYAAGDLIEIEEEVFISVGAGSVIDGQSFTVEVFASTDDSGLLSASGMNTLFQGSGAADIAVCSDVSNDLTRIAVSQGPEMTDNAGLKKMIALRDTPIGNLNDLTFDVYYQQFVSDLGQMISIKEMQHENISSITQNLANQQAEISGVDINEQATQMIVYEQMFQGMAKYIETIQNVLSTLMELI